MGLGVGIGLGAYNVGLGFRDVKLSFRVASLGLGVNVKSFLSIVGAKTARGSTAYVGLKGCLGGWNVVQTVRKPDASHLVLLYTACTSKARGGFIDSKTYGFCKEGHIVFG